MIRVHRYLRLGAVLALVVGLTPWVSAQESYQEYEVERKPILLNFSELSAAIEVPSTLASRTITDRTTFRVLVAPEGTYLKHVVLASADTLLTLACEKVLPKARFQPAVRLNQTVACWTTVAFNFQFDGTGQARSEALPQNLSFVRQKIGYPKLAKESGILGRVMVRVTVSTGGRVTDYEILTSPHRLLTEPVVAGLPELRFSPGSVNNAPVETRVDLPFDFQLVGIYNAVEFSPNVKAGKAPVSATGLTKSQQRRQAKGKAVTLPEPDSKKFEKRAKQEQKDLKRQQKKLKKQAKRGKVNLPPLTDRPAIDQWPELLNARKLNRKLRYPKLARIIGREGTVVAALYVQPDIKKPTRKTEVVGARIVQSPEYDFTLEAGRLFKRARFSPARGEDGTPKGTWVHFIVTFTAEGGSLEKKKGFFIFKKLDKPQLSTQVSALPRAPHYD